MKKRNMKLVLMVMLVAVGFSISAAEETPLVGARYPALSPEGKRIAFSYMGDIWLVSSEGGRAMRLTDHVAYDREPIWSPDGQWLAFTSDRMGNYDVYLMNADGGTPTRLTYHSGNDLASGFTPDGQWILFVSSRSSSASVYKISVQGGNALPVLDTYWTWPYYPRVSPDGSTLLFVHGMESGSWWRRGYKGSNTAKIWTKEFIQTEAELVVSESNNCFWPSWGPDGQTIYFVTDRDFDSKNIWSCSPDGSEMKAVTQFKDKDVKWLSVASKIPLAVYERDFGIWKTDLETGDSQAIPIQAPAETKENRFFFLDNEPVSEYRLSPDGKKLAAVVRGEIFIASTEGGYARNVTNSPWRESGMDWDKDSRNVVYVSDVDASPDLYIVSALGDGQTLRLTRSEEDELLPRFSPDGKWIAYFRGKRQMRLIQSDGTEDRLLVEDDFGGRFADGFVWSPDSRYLAVVVRRNSNVDLFAVEVENGEKTLLTNTAYDESEPLWSPDGKFLLFASNRYGHSFPEFTGKWDIYQLFFEPQKPEFDEDTFEEMFKTRDPEEKEEKKKEEPAVQVKFKLEDIDLQTQTVVDTAGSETQFVLSPKDKSTVYFVSRMDGQNHLWTTSLKKEERGRYEPFLAQVQNPGSLQMDSEGKFLYYLSRGRIGQIDLNGKRNKNIALTTKIRVDKVADYEQMLAEVYYTLKHYYYDPELHETDWSGIYRQFRPVLQQVREDQDFYDYANEMIGHLNSSHTGIRAPFSGSAGEPSAHVGAEWEFEGGKILLKRLIKNGPLHFYKDKVSPGDELVAVNGKPLEAGQNIWKYFNGQLDKRLQLTFKARSSGDPVDISIKAISGGAENRLLLEEWIESRNKIVRDQTNDQIAYLYMRAMGRGDLDRFLKELERDAVPRKGLILDLRFNFGGNVHDRVLQALTKPLYAKWRVRGLSETPQSTFGVTDKPVVLLINEVTLSDGEMTANGFKTLGRGPVIGNTTYGWLIFTTSARLMNGGSFRLPFWGCYTLDGQDLETHGGVKPDIFIINDLNHDLLNQDPQLDKAIEKILELIK